MTGLLLICGAAAFLVTLVVLGSNRRPAPPTNPAPTPPPAPPDLASAVLSERDRLRRDREAAEIRAKLDSLIAGEFAAPEAEAPRPNP